MLTYLKYLLQLIVSPGQGWLDIGRTARDDSRRVAFAGLFPWLVIVGLSSLIRLLYVHDGTVIDTLLAGLINFGKFSIAYFMAPLIINTLLYTATDADISDERLHILTACSIGLLGGIALLENCLPVSMTVLHFLPFFVGIVIWKGTDYLGVPSRDTGAFMLLALLAIIAPPYIIGWLLGLIL